MPEITSSSITPADVASENVRRRYEEINSQIRDDRNAAERFWENLSTMKREALYKVKYSTLDAWAKAELGISRAHLYRVLNYQEGATAGGESFPARPPRAKKKAPVVKLPAVTDPAEESYAFPTEDEPEVEKKPEPAPRATERQWRSICTLAAPLRNPAWLRCLAECGGKHPTQKDVDRTVAEIVAEEAAQGRVEYPTDAVGQPIVDPRIQRIFESTGPLVELQRDVQRMRNQVKDIAATDVGVNLRVQQIDTALKEVWQAIKHAMPHAVIPAGAEKKVQSRALQVGWLTAMQWERLPAELRKVQ